MPPEPIEPLVGEFNARGPLKGCIQQQQAYGRLFNVQYDEDCLYLDVWTPEGRVQGTLPDELLPVIVSKQFFKSY